MGMFLSDMAVKQMQMAYQRKCINGWIRCKKADERDIILYQYVE